MSMRNELAHQADAFESTAIDAFSCCKPAGVKLALQAALFGLALV